MASKAEPGGANHAFSRLAGRRPRRKPDASSENSASKLFHVEQSRAPARICAHLRFRGGGRDGLYFRRGGVASGGKEDG